jgi:cytochrome c553
MVAFCSRLAIGISLLATCLFAAPSWAVAADEAGEEFFERKIRPLLAQHCFACHGRGQKKGGLSLDSREGLLAGGESGASVMLGKAEKSMLIEAVEYDGALQMPPNGKLAADEIAALKQWVSLGAPWPASKEGEKSGGGSIRSDAKVTDADRQFWSFQPVRDAVPPQVKRADWPLLPLDRFVLAKIEEAKLEPVGAADPRTFVRRASFDLLGLPPSAEEVDDFEKAVSQATTTKAREAAYAALIDRLLASPHYGERWARHWLDVARYGEDQAHTFAARVYKSGYRYRDWLVEAFNRDLPFDRFVMEQIAGDLLKDEQQTESDLQQRLPALGFFALGPVYYADAGCAQKAKTDEYDDRIDTLCRGFLGLTVSCARCHDHKFDPIPTQDYYALAGVFASTNYVEAPLAPADVVKRYDDAQAKIKEAEQRVKDGQARETERLAEAFAKQTAEYLVAAWKFDQQRRSPKPLNVAAFVKEAKLNEMLLTRWQQHLEEDVTVKHELFAAWRDCLSKQDKKQDLSGDAAVLAEVQKVADALQATIVDAFAKRRAIEDQHAKTLAELKPGMKAPAKPALEKPVEKVLKYVFEGNKRPLAIPQQQADKLYSDESRRVVADLQKQVETLKKSAGDKYPIAHSVTEGTVANVKLHNRGNHKDLGDEVPRHFLSILTPGDPKPFAKGSGRLELAQAIASRDNPLTARVFVNRVWQHHFGRGIVGTPSNFGLLGERPTHPELLDHLASRLMQLGWSVKQLHREIMLSATYRLAAAHHAANENQDPDNRLLWRMNRRRLDIESWRDAVLAASGKLDLKVGGPSFDVADANNGRRTLYASVSRHELNPMLRLFDFPDPNLTSERRVITTVPMQQLFVLNSEFMIRQAKGLAVRVQNEKLADDNARVERVYRLVLARKPSESERKIATEFLASDGQKSKENAPPTPLQRVVQESIEKSLLTFTLWDRYCQALLASNEFTFVD